MHWLISVTESLGQIYRKDTLQNVSLVPPPPSPSLARRQGGVGIRPNLDDDTRMTLTTNDNAFRDHPKFPGYLGRVLGILPRVKNSVPPSFS